MSASFCSLVPSGTIEGSIIVVGSKNMRSLVTVKKAHLGIVTTLTFAKDSKSVSSFCKFMNTKKQECNLLMLLFYLILEPCCQLPSTQLQG
jgi:hypothetical protein